MGQATIENPMALLRGEELARGIKVRADAAMFSADDLVYLARCAEQSSYQARVTIINSVALSKQDRARIVAASTYNKRVIFC